MGPWRREYLNGLGGGPGRGLPLQVARAPIGPTSLGTSCALAARTAVTATGWVTFGVRSEAERTAPQYMRQHELECARWPGSILRATVSRGAGKNRPREC